MGDYYNESMRAQGIKERFEQHKQLRMSTDQWTYTHGKEYHFTLSWSADGQKFINNKIDYYDGKLYYFDHGYLFSVNEDGSELKILLKVGKYFKTDMAVSVDSSTVFLMANECGIYLYQHGRNLTMSHFTLEGKFVENISIPGDVSQVYVAGQRIYFTRTQTNQQVCYYDCKTEEDTVIMEATKVLELYGDGERAVFRVAFERVRGGMTIYDEGWYVYHFDTVKYHCLTSRNCPPHYVFAHPDCYKPGSVHYIDFKDSLKVRAVDLVRNIMWVTTSLKEKLDNGITTQEYWEPFVLAPETQPVADAPIWRMTYDQFVAGAKIDQLVGASYFDGSNFLNGRAMHYMKSFDVEGNMTQYGTDRARGACHNFRVLHGYVYADFEGTGWQQYAIEDGKLSFVRSCQFGSNAPITDQVRDLIVGFKG